MSNMALAMTETLETRVAKAIEAGETASFLKSFSAFEKFPDFLRPDDVGFPPILQSSFQVDRASADWDTIHTFERVSLELRQRVFEPGSSIYENDLQHIDGSTLSSVLTRAVEQYRSSVAKGDLIREIKCHLEGLIIENNLDLSGIDFPCSIRLINCYIEGGLTLARTKLTTLDLSGSIIGKGISAPHLVARGAVRLRRSVITGILDFGAAEIVGPLDAADSVCVPANCPPAGVAWVSDRSAVNFGLARVGKEMRVNRVRWFGGVNMRSMHVSGSLFFTDAIVRSPIAVVEKLVIDGIGKEKKNFFSYQRSASAAEKDLAILLHGAARSQRPLVRMEQLPGLTLPGCPTKDQQHDNLEFSQSLLGRLLFESAAVQSSAIRADGAVIDGVFSAESMRVGGRVRLKKITVKSALTFSGGHFRTFRSLRETLASIKAICPDRKYANIHKFCAYILNRLDEVDDREPNARRQYAIDLRRANIGASVEFRKDSRKLLSRKGDKKIATQIARTLCLTNEDPVKFLQVFFGRPGELNRFLDNPENKTKSDYNEYRIARHKIQNKVSRKIDKPTYAVLDFEKKNPVVSDDRLRENFPPARISKNISTAQRRFVAKQCGNLGRIKSTLLIGEISLSGAQIGGSVSFLGFMANVFDEPVRSRRPTILLDNAHIRDTLDIRDSVGIQAISAEHAHIGGSVRMADEPVFKLEHDRYGPARRRALFTAVPKMIPRGATTAYPKFNFERTEIGGDATFVFDHRYGPTLDLAFLKVEGKLTILPAVGGVELNKDEFEKETFQAEAVRRGASVSIGKIIRWGAGKVASVLTGLIPDKARDRVPLFRKMKQFGDFTSEIIFDRNLAKEKLRTFKPYIDLRSATATVLAHPASAWPQQDSLLVEGLRYDRTKDFGPLLSRRRTWHEVETQSRRNVRSIILTGIIAALASMIVPSFASFTAGEMFDLSQFSKLTDNGNRNYAMFGPRTVRITQTIFGLSVWILLMKYFTQPRSTDSVPMAIRYLRRQRRKFNVRRASSAIHPYDPYIHAAKVLRADGHLLAADRVELERLRKRRRALSWRTSAPLRLMLLFTDWIMQYGFAPIRIVAIATVFLLSGTLLTEAAKNGELVVPTTNLSMPLSGHSLSKKNIRRPTTNYGPFREELVTIERWNGGPTSSLPPWAYRDPERSDGGKDHILGQDRYTPYEQKQMVPAVYVLDVMVPFLDLGQESSFDFFQKKDAGVNQLMEPDYSKHFWMIPFWLKVAGWFLTSIIAISVAARLETIMARNEDS